MFKHIAIALATVAALTGTAKATSDDGAKLGTATILLLSESVCENKLTPLMTLLKAGLAKEVSPKELQVASAMVISSWKTRSDKATWCAGAAKNLKKLEAEFNASN